MTRSEVNDPASVAQTIRSLSAEEPLVARAVSEGGQVANALKSAQALIPALPVPQDGYFPEGSKITSVAGHPDLYELAAPAPQFPPSLGATRTPQLPPPDKFFFGLIGDVFVTAPSLKAAQQAAGLKPTALGTPPGAVAFSVPLRTSDFGISEEGTGGGVTLTTVKGAVEASADGLRLRAEAGL